jgi:hypothetical protein
MTCTRRGRWVQIKSRERHHRQGRCKYLSRFVPRLHLSLRQIRVDLQAGWSAQSICLLLLPLHASRPRHTCSLAYRCLIRWGRRFHQSRFSGAVQQKPGKIRCLREVKRPNCTRRIAARVSTETVDSVHTVTEVLLIGEPYSNQGGAANQREQR